MRPLRSTKEQKIHATASSTLINPAAALKTPGKTRQKPWGKACRGKAEDERPAKANVSQLHEDRLRTQIQPKSVSSYPSFPATLRKTKTKSPSQLLRHRTVGNNARAHTSQTRLIYVQIPTFVELLLQIPSPGKVTCHSKLPSRSTISSSPILSISGTGSFNCAMGGARLAVCWERGLASAQLQARRVFSSFPASFWALHRTTRWWNQSFLRAIFGGMLLCRKMNVRGG